MEAICSTRSVPGAHLLCGARRSASQSRSTSTKFKDPLYVRLLAPRRPQEHPTDTLRFRRQAAFLMHLSGPAHARQRHCQRQRFCENTLSPPHPVGGRASQTVSPGSPVGEYPPRKETPKSTHARRRPGEGAPSDKHELCDRKFTCPRRRPGGDTHASPSYPIRSPRTLGKPSSDSLKGPSENPPPDTLKGPSENPPPDTLKGPSEKPPQTPSKESRKALSSGPTGSVTRRTAEASNTALSRGGGRVLRDTLAAPRGQGREVT